MARLYLGLDSSTQSLTAIVIDVESHASVAEVSVSFDDYKQAYGTSHGTASRDETGGRSGTRVWSYPLLWVEALDALLEKVAVVLQAKGLSLKQVAAISGSGQQHGSVYLNDTANTRLAKLAEAKSLRGGLDGIFSREQSPIWMDSSTGTEVREIEERVGGRTALQRLTGNHGIERFTGPQIRRIAKEEPETYARTAHIGLVSSFMASVLTGKVVSIEPGDGAGMNLMDIQTRQWSQPALEATASDLSRRLGPVQPSHTVAGAVSPYFVRRFGFAADCRSVLWSGDNPCSLIGLGIVSPGTAAASLGTSDTLFAALGAPRLCESGEGCLFASPDGAHSMALLCFANGSLTRELVRDQFGLSWSGFSSLLRGSPPGNRVVDSSGKGGPFRMLLPYLFPEIAPLVPQPLWVYHNLSPRDAEGCVRAVVESRAFAARIHSEWMGERIRRLRITGGGARNPEILQIFSDVFDAEVETLETTSSAALGAALRAWHADTVAAGQPLPWEQIVQPFTKPVGRVSPNPEAVRVYTEALEEFRTLERHHAVR